MPAESPFGDDASAGSPFGDDNPGGSWRRRLRHGTRKRAEDPSELVVLTTVADETQAEIVCGRLTAAGIPATQQKTNVTAAVYGGLQDTGGRNIYVRRGDAPRAAELLAQAGPSDDELADLSTESYREITGDTQS
jgi:hypothetical protein